MKWRFVNTGFNSGPMNISIDEAILHYHSKGVVPPTLRFYSWSPAAVSIGYFQKSDSEIDIHKCRKYKLDIVRRMSGGNTILHDDELAYSIMLPENIIGVSSSSGASLEIFMQGLIRGFLSIGIKAASMPSKSSSNKSNLHSSYSLSVGGKKISESTCFRKSGSVLLHGSVFNSIDTEKLFIITKSDNPNGKSSYDKILTSIKHENGKSENWDDICKAFLLGLQHSLDVEIEPGALTQDEIDMAKVLCDTKYSRDEWTLRR